MQSVIGDGGQPLSFIQEDKNDDADFYVILPKVLSAGEKYTLTTTYNGKDAVSNEGSGNYYPMAREDWYPNNANFGLGEYTDYDLTFRIPKGIMKMAATGNLISESNEGSQDVSIWKSDIPLTVAGFNFGKFKKRNAAQTPNLFSSYVTSSTSSGATGMTSAGAPWGSITINFFIVVALAMHEDQEQAACL